MRQPSPWPPTAPSAVVCPAIHARNCSAYFARDRRKRKIRRPGCGSGERHALEIEIEEASGYPSVTLGIGKSIKMSLKA